MYPEWVKGSRQTGELIEWVYKKIDRCVNLEWVAASTRTGEGLEDIRMTNRVGDRV